MIAPSGPFDVDAFTSGVAFLRERYEVRFNDGVLVRSGYLAGSDDRRLTELREAIADRDASVIVAARGGYGAMRIAAELDPTSIAARPKLLVGFSDITALHGVWARAGVSSLHASMVAALGRSETSVRGAWIAALEGMLPTPRALTPLVGCGGRAVGRLVGGNLATLAAMVGTPLLPDLNGAVLFIEDVNEAPYRIDRMLTQLLLAGRLERVVGVVAGSFTRCEPVGNSLRAEEVLAERLRSLLVPVLSGLPAGHGEQNIPIPFGALVELDGASGMLRFLKQ